jgi:hypothetical protein
VQSTAWGVEPDARAESSAGRDSIVAEGLARSETVNVGITAVALAFGVGGTEAGVGFPADMSQQNKRAGAP